MCELFGMSANRPHNAGPWMRRFRERGGKAADNSDGWGLAYLEHGVFRLHKAPTAGAYSAEFGALCGTVDSPLILGHVRHARHPRINSFDNTHPFIRLCCGREWVFAHNGLVPAIMEGPDMRLHGTCRPQGETDSEYAFCYLLEYIAAHFGPGIVHGGSRWFEDVASAAAVIAAHGKFNFLMSDGDYLIAYGHDRLHHLETRTGSEKVALVATEPLDEADAWTPFAPAELRIYRGGEAVGSSITAVQCQAATAISGAAATTPDGHS